MLDRWINAKPRAKKKVSFGNTPANSANSAKNPIFLADLANLAEASPKNTFLRDGFLADLAELAGALPKNTFLRAPLRMLDGRLQYRVPTTRDGAATPVAVALVAEARAAHVVVVADGAELHIYTPVFYRSDLHQRLAALAPDVLAVLQQQSAQRIASAAADRFEERAAAVEFDAGIPRAWAEGYAAMQQAEPPAWTVRHPGLWPDLVDTTGRFLHRWGRQAAELGWDPIDLFGASPRAPLGRVDQQGLLFFLQDGCEIVAMTENTASIRRPSGVVQTFRRAPKGAREPGTTPIWELVRQG